MEDITLKLHIAVMRFVQNRVDRYREAGTAGFTTAELVGNAALALVALVGLWTFLQTNLFQKLQDYVTANFFHS